MSSPDVEIKLPFSLLGTLLVRANEGRTLFRGAHSITILLDGKQTGEKFTTLLVTSPRGAGCTSMASVNQGRPIGSRSPSSTTITIAREWAGTIIRCFRAGPLSTGSKCTFPRTHPGIRVSSKPMKSPSTKLAAHNV
jgi:hypothetical protein